MTFVLPPAYAVLILLQINIQAQRTDFFTKKTSHIHTIRVFGMKFFHHISHIIIIKKIDTITVIISPNKIILISINKRRVSIFVAISFKSPQKNTAILSEIIYCVGFFSK